MSSTVTAGVVGNPGVPPRASDGVVTGEPVAAGLDHILHARRWWLLPVHVVSTVLIQSSMLVAQFMIPYLAKKHYHAGEWTVLLFTAAPLVLPALSVFWQIGVKRLSPRVFLAVFWVVTFLPWALAWWSTSVVHLAVMMIVTSIGYSAWAPLGGEFLSKLYPAPIRGRMFGVISMAVLVIAGPLGHAIGEILEVDADLYRLILPVASGLTLVGMAMLMGLQALMPRDPAAKAEPDSRGKGIFEVVLEPVLHMRQILRSDGVFFRYEAAYMTYGIGWMIIWAMLPPLGLKLGLGYEAYANATSLPMQIAMAVCVLPFGLLNDRAGADRVSALAFAVYTIFPMGLLAAQNATHLAISCALWGVCSAAVQMGWTLGPVGLAPTPDRVSQYLAIHATLVGVRGAVFQTVGVALYKLSGSFAPSLILASVGFAWAAWQMWSLRSAFAARMAEKKT